MAILCRSARLYQWSVCTLPPGAMEAEMQAIAPMIVGFVALTAVSVQAAPSPNQENWGLLGRPLSFTLGDQACGEGWHQALWRDWRGGWWWGPCANR